ncbi:hypothetical protein MBANPS3_004165 [Mucor bainieri]
MATKEDRYPKEYKPFPNDKPISSSQGSSGSSMSMSNNGTGSSSGKQHPDFREALKSTISRHMKGFRATNVITYKRFRDKSTWQRPGEFAELVAIDDEDTFTADPKEAWPIMQDMNIDIPVRELTKQHRVVDRNWTVPVSNKKFKQPEPIYPQSTGVKLRNVEEIMLDYSKKAPAQTTSKAPSLSLSVPPTASKSSTPTTHSIPRVADKSQRPLQLIPDKIKGVLQNLTDTRRKPSSSASTTPAKSHGSTPSSNTPRKSSALKSSTITPHDSKIKKQSTPSTTTTTTTTTNTTTTTTTAKSANTQSRPRVSSKTIPMEKVAQIENIPDLMEARKYLVGHDEVEFRSLSSLQEMPKNAQPKQRPQLYIRLYPKPDDQDMPKGLKQHIASVNNIKIKQERAALAPSTKKNQARASAHSKSTPSTTSKTTSLPPSDPSTKSAGKSNIRKKSQSDQNQAPIRTSTTTKSKQPTTTTTTSNIKREKEEEDTKMAKPGKQAYPSSVSAEFLKSTKIPKRSNSVQKSSFSSHDTELEEGETISPSPSPIRTKSRPSHTGVDEEGSSSSSSGTERPPPPPPTASRKLYTATTAAAAAAAAVTASTPTPASSSATTTSTTTTSSKRRDEDKSSREREKDRDHRHRDESVSSSRRDRSHRKSRSRSPVSQSHRSESKNRRSPPPPSSSSARRQTSSESSHRHRSPAVRSEREPSRSEKEVGMLASITAVNTASSRTEKETLRSDRELSRPEKETTSTSVHRTERSDRERESSGRETKRKSLHDAADSKSSTSEPPTKRLATTKTSSSSSSSSSTSTSSTSSSSSNKDDSKSSYTHTNTTPTTTIEKDTKYTSNSNPVSNSSSSSTSKDVKKAAATTSSSVSTPPVASTPKSVSTPTASSSISSSTTITAAQVPEKIMSATAPNAESPEQLKIFMIMFKQLAHANKRRGDHQKDPVVGIIDHFHALCDYILNFHFNDKANKHVPFKQASVAWKSLFPFSDSLLLKLQANHLNELYGLCLRLVALIRYYIYSRMESATRPLLTKHLSSSGSQDSSYTDRTCIEMTEGLLREHEKAEKCYKESEAYMTFGKMASQFPGTFKDVCIDGNILAGITLGGEAGVSVGPMFPFTPYSPLHHAAIVSKCILNEYVTKNNLNYSPISKPEEFM